MEHHVVLMQTAKTMMEALSANVILAGILELLVVEMLLLAGMVAILMVVVGIGA